MNVKVLDGILWLNLPAPSMALSLADTPTLEPGLAAPTPDLPAEPTTMAGLTPSPVNDLQIETAQALYQSPERAISNLNDLKETFGPRVATDVLAAAPETFGTVSGEAALEAGVAGRYATMLNGFGDEGWRSTAVGVDLDPDALQRTPDGRPMVYPTDGLGQTLDGVEVARGGPVGWVGGLIAEGRGQVPLFWGLGPSVSANFGIAVDDDEIAITSTVGAGVGAGGFVGFGVGAFGAYGAGDRLDDVRDIGGLGVETGAVIGAGAGVQGSAGIAINNELEAAGVVLGAPVVGTGVGAGAYIELQNTHVLPILNYQDLRADSVAAIQNLPQEIQDHLNTVKTAAGQGNMPTGQWLLEVYGALRGGITGY